MQLISKIINEIKYREQFATFKSYIVSFYAKNFIEVIQTSVSLKLNKDRAFKKLKKL